ncbi:hypothetical protein EB796_003801 [Bugula neritina]|uniref:Peptidase aspartic putative domain-containing protein n=1 Tax=Bugula neritina TaxID=10212 RepID=A0A7J7KGU3_BUGNE|nr:hypothetical protein EB796_003801 [Bugula neritina]
MVDFLDKFTHSVVNESHEISIENVDSFIKQTELKVKDIVETYEKLKIRCKNEVNPEHEKLLNDFLSDVHTLKEQILSRREEERALQEAKQKLEEQMQAYKTKRDIFLRKVESARASSTPNSDRLNTSNLPSANESNGAQQHQTDIQEILKTFTDNLAESFNSKLQASADNHPKPYRKSMEPNIFSGNTLEFADWEVDMDAYVADEGLSDREALRYLKKFVAGDAKKAILGLLTYRNEDSYREARDKLRERFSMQGGVARILLQKLDNWLNIRHGDGKKFREFGDFLDQIRRSMSSTEGLKIVDTETYIERICQKLPDNAKFAWTQKVCRARRQKTDHPSFSVFTEFILEQADCYMSSIMQSTSKEPKSESPKSRNDDRPHRRAASYQTENGKKVPYCHFCCENIHYTRGCSELTKKPPKERKDFTLKKGLCFSCMNGKHWSNECNRKQTCKIFQRMHPTILHDPDWKQSEKPDRQQTQANASSNTNKDGSDKTKTCNATGVTSSSSFSTMVPVYVSAGGKEKLVYALLDNLSDITFINKQTALDIGASGIPDTLDLETMNAVTRSETLRYENLQIRGYLTDATSTIEAVERPAIRCNEDNIPTDEKCSKIPHLKSIARHLPPKLDIPFGLMIGKDSPEIITPLLTMRGEPGETTACETRFGWTLCGGKLRSKLASSYMTNGKLFPLVEQDFEDPGGKSMSQQDLKFLEILNDGIFKDEDGSYVMPLPFKSTPILPKNRHQAEQRLQLLRKKLQKDTAYKHDYLTSMKTLLDKGFAEEVSETEITEDDNIALSEEAASFLTKDFYVDDGIFSTDDVQAAKQLLSAARGMCSKGNLRLHKFVSNKAEVLVDLPRSEIEAEASSFNSIVPTQRTLGVSWCLKTDQLCFTSNINVKPFTRRGILSMAAQVYDPIGLVSPFILLGKNILQETKCFGEVKRAELHHFSDASEDGYGACSYSRLIDVNDNVHCSLILSKARVAPLEPPTIPRMELQGAVVATKLHEKLKRELDMEIDATYFWTDSTIVLGYIKNETTKFSPYVTNRVTQIRKSAEPQQWKHISGTKILLT